MADSLEGNLDRAAKERMWRVWTNVAAGPNSGLFAKPVKPLLKFVEANIFDHPDSKSGQNKKTVVTIHTTVVTEEFLNAGGFMHGACTAFLVDLCTTAAITGLHSEHGSTVSLNLDITYHAPAVLNAPLRITSTTLAGGRRVYTARCEIWDTARNSLVASGVQLMMHQSPQTSAKL